MSDERTREGFGTTGTIGDSELKRAAAGVMNAERIQRPISDTGGYPIHHASSGFAVSRLPGGNVRVGFLDRTLLGPPIFARAVDLSPEEWASCVAHVSEQGGTSQAFREALDFHKDAPRVARQTDHRLELARKALQEVDEIARIRGLAPEDKLNRIEVAVRDTERGLTNATRQLERSAEMEWDPRVPVTNVGGLSGTELRGAVDQHAEAMAQRAPETAGIAPAQQDPLAILQFTRAGSVHAGAGGGYWPEGDVLAAARLIAKSCSPGAPSGLVESLANHLVSLVFYVPPGPERSTAISRAQESGMWGHAALSRTGRG